MKGDAILKRILLVSCLMWLLLTLTGCAIQENLYKDYSTKNTQVSNYPTIESTSNKSVQKSTSTLPARTPLATPGSKTANVPAPLDQTSTTSVANWFYYAIANKDIDALSKITADQVAYVVYIEGGDWQDKSRFLDDFSERIGSSHPTCIGSGFADGMFVAWFSGWDPLWAVSRSCYDSCSKYDPPLTSEVVGFIFYAENGLYELHKVWIAKPDLMVEIYPSLMGKCQMSEAGAINSTAVGSTGGKSCPGAPTQRVVVGKTASVCTKKDSVALREVPSKAGDVIIRLVPGATFKVIDGPRCSDNWSWWKINTSNGKTGWISEGGDSDDPYYICP